jgi:hypothetical protein
MNGLTTALLGRACRIFLTLAYPGGEDTIPEKRRRFLHVDPGQPLETYLPPAAADVCQCLTNPDGSFRGYAYRLGSATFPHLKLQVLDYNHGATCLFGVDTHDAFSRQAAAPPPDHPDAAGWTRLQVANRQLKEQIERAWEKDGLTTFNSVLRGDLDKPASGPPRPEGTT